MKTKQITIDAMLAAVCVVLGMFAIDLGNIKLTFESVPILMGALLFGPLDGALIGGIGTFISQFLRYGITATTALWIVPYVLCGILVGFVAKYKKYSLRYTWVIPVIIIAEFMITGLNTLSLYIDANIYGYYTPVLILGALGIRLVICGIRSVVYGVGLVPLIRAIVRFAKVGKVRTVD